MPSTTTDTDQQAMDQMLMKSLEQSGQTMPVAQALRAVRSERERALREAAELCRLPVPAASDVSADYLAGRYDAAEEVRLAILSLIGGGSKL